MLGCLCVIAHLVCLHVCWCCYVYALLLILVCLYVDTGMFINILFLMLVCLHVHVGMFTCCYRYVYMSLLTLVCFHVRFCHLEGEVEEQHNMNQSILYNHGICHTLFPAFMSASLCNMLLISCCKSVKWKYSDMLVIGYFGLDCVQCVGSRNVSQNFTSDLVAYVFGWHWRVLKVWFIVSFECVICPRHHDPVRLMGHHYARTN